MALLASFIGGLLSTLIDWLAKYFTKRLAVTVAIVAAFTSLTAAMWAGLQALVSGIVVAMPSEIGTVASWIAPGNLTECLAAVATAKFLRFVYDAKVRVLDFQSRV